MITNGLLFALVIITQAFKVSYTSDLPDLEFPTTFTLKAQRVSLTDDVVENYEMWQTSDNSRIDYNDGYVKSIVQYNNSDLSYIKYSIHPTANIDQKVETACSQVNEASGLESILPDVDNEYEVVGNETMSYVDTVKFSFDFVDGNTKSRNTLWALYDDTDEVWIPVRYEALDFNNWLGSKDKHEVWNFYDYSTSFSVEKTFDISTYDCVIKNSLDISDALTKNLLLANPDKDHHVNAVFKKFKKDFGRNYARKQEHLKRKSIFKKNMRHVISRNRQNLGYKLALNHFADKSPEEMNKYLGLKRRPAGKVGTVPFPYGEGKLKDMADTLPTEYDARLLGLVSEVKNQEECGSCWTFGTTAAVEGALARINGGKLLALSNQAIIDCAWAFGGDGCDGGTDNAAYEWIMEYGLPTESEYGPYLNQNGLCNINNMTKTFPIRGYTDVTPLNAVALKIALVNHGPLTVSVHASQEFTLYSSGIFYDTACSSQALDHEVTLVGYGERDGDTFWILKNSWGSNWGMGGYMYISALNNNCGVTTEPTYVVF